MGAGPGAPSFGGGQRHSCASRSMGDLYCWGNNQRGQLGLGYSSGTDILGPTQVTEPVGTTWTQVAVGKTASRRGAELAEAQTVDQAVGAALKDVRIAAGMTIRDLSRQAGVSSAMISRIFSWLSWEQAYSTLFEYVTPGTETTGTDGTTTGADPLAAPKPPVPAGFGRRRARRPRRVPDRLGSALTRHRRRRPR